MPFSVFPPLLHQSNSLLLRYSWTVVFCFVFFSIWLQIFLSPLGSSEELSGLNNKRGFSLARALLPMGCSAMIWALGCPLAGKAEVPEAQAAPNTAACTAKWKTKRQCAQVTHRGWQPQLSITKIPVSTSTSKLSIVQEAQFKGISVLKHVLRASLHGAQLSFRANTICLSKFFNFCRIWKQRVTELLLVH